MDNRQFRALLQSDQKAQKSSNGTAEPGFKKPALGSRARPSMPMTPRSVAGHNTSNEFARQVAEHRREHDGQPPTKKFRSSAAPKGSKLAAGYQDRTLARRGEDGEETRDDKEKRFKALEEMYKLQQIDEATFEGLKSEIGIGGSLDTTHLVKGLDWKLLQRARRGDDLNNSTASETDAAPDAPPIDVDDELDHALEKDIATKASDAEEDSAPPQNDQQVDSLPVTRDEILRRLKESRTSRQAPEPTPAAAIAPSLGGKFKKLTSASKSNKKKFVETVNGRRREVLVITNKDGSTKRKTRWLEEEGAAAHGNDNEPLGMEVPAEFLAKQKALLEQQLAAEEEDDDIFGGVADYDPLAGLNSDSDESEGDKKSSQEIHSKANTTESTGETKSRNYFSTDNEVGQSEDKINPITKDPNLLAALKRAAAMRRTEQEGSNDGEGETDDLDPQREAKHKQFLAQLKERDRADAADMDLGFGESRFGDEDEEDGEVWDGEGGEGKKAGAGRKRGPKKRKGDKDSVHDVMSVLEGRKKEQS